jgi:hypothetical protein
MKKTILLVVAVTFLMASTCFGAAVDPTKIVVPRDSARIVETYASPKADAPVIAYVQDIHVNYEAQKAEVDILEALIRDYGFDLVLVEGKKQDLNTDLKKYRQEDKDVRLAAGEELLRNATIVGIEYLDLVSDYNFTIQGIEDMELYKTETQDHVNLTGKNEDMSKLVGVLKNIASNLKLHIYTKEMRDLDDKIDSYDKDEIGLVEYVKFIEGASAAGNIEVKTFPNLTLFIESANLEGQIDFPAVEKERTTVADAIEKALKDKAKEEFLAANLKFRTGDISQGEFYAYLEGVAQKAKIDLAANKNLTAYTQYITTYEKIDTTLLFKEIDKLVEQIKSALIKTPEQKRLSQIDKGLSILSDFVNTKLVPDEYNFYVQNKADFDMDGWLVFMRENSAKFGLTNPVPDDLSSIKANLPILERFYAISFDRDKVFIKNIEANLSKYGKDKAILITGGFHTTNMKNLLKQQGYSYAVIAPRVDVIRDYSDLYKKRMALDLDYVNSVTKPGVAANPVTSQRSITMGIDNTSTAAQIEEALKKVKAEKAKAGVAGEGMVALQQQLTAELTRLEVVRDAAAVNSPERAALSNLIAELKVAPDDSWLGMTIPADQADRIANKPAVQPAVTFDQLPQNVRDPILQGLQAVGITAAPNIPIHIIDQEGMEGIPGPIYANGRIVIGHQHWAFFQANPHILAHEYTAAIADANAIPNAHNIATQVEDTVKARLLTSGDAEQVTTGMIIQDADHAYLAMRALKDIPKGSYAEVRLSDNLKGQRGVVDAWVAFLRANGIEVEVKYTIAEPGVVNVSVFKSKGGEQIGQSKVNIAPKGQEYRLPGVMNVGLMCAYLQAQPTNQALRDTLRGQYRVLTNQELDLPADPTELVKRIREITIALPAPTTVNFNQKLEEERTQKIFAVAA